MPENRLKEVRTFMFTSPSLVVLYLDGNAIRILRKGAFEGLTSLNLLRLGNNQIHTADLYCLNGLQPLKTLTMNNNFLTTLPYLGNLTKLRNLRLSFNSLDLDSQTAVFRNLQTMGILALQNAELRGIPDLSKNPKLLYLFLSKNRIKTIKDGTFLFNSLLKQLIINSNNIEILSNESFTGATSLELIDLSNNPVRQIADSTFSHKALNMVLLINTVLQHPLLISTASHPIFSFILLSSDLESSVISDEPSYDEILASSGYLCKELNFLETKCFPCKLGTYISSSGDRCENCPAGGFYQNEVAYTGIKSHGMGCKECPHGKYVAPERIPGRAETDCQSCPLGTELDKFSGFRACSCLDEHYRLSRFEGCLICTKGYTCVNETIDLATGFYWIWSSREIAEQYRKFSTELQIRERNYDPNFISFKGSIPVAYACPVAESCIGGLYSQCKAGYEGPLCAICAAGYFRFLSNCEKCPTIPWIVGQITLILFVFILLLIIILRDKKDKNQNGRTITDIILARLKIVIGFYQVSSSTFDSLSYISWPGPLLEIMKYAKMLQLNLLQILPPSCVSNSIHTNAYTHFLISIAFSATVVFFCLIFLVLMRMQINRNNTLSVSAKNDKIFNTKVQSYKCLFLVLFITFPSTCSIIFKILPESCHELCSHSNSQCMSYLRADYSIKCDDATHRIYGILSRVALLYTFIFPLFLLVILKRERETQMKENQKNAFPVLQGTKFLYENYSPSCWYWEILELTRKILVSLFLIMFQVESRMGLGVTTILSGVYAVVFALYKPIEDKFEHWLQMVSLLATSVNFTVGMLLKIPLEETSSSISSETDALIVTVVLMAANVVVIGLIAVSYIAKMISAINELRKTPQCSLSCFLSVLQLASEAPGVGDNVDQNLAQADTSQDDMLTCDVERIQEVEIEEENSTSLDEKLENDQSEFENREKIKNKKNI
ncbi:uncharacterized protein LOC116301966 [Actinia tenebrosa]|uniref:Uncharacterized protein LOC116301966 n=1 Tax=Actinia tenebrosa TaxID=6105 RepID=A0A6P8IKN6_ACTTE|nr:uncharacterized protein LOC116301966 [Actinia tenebrosa]